MNSSTVKSETEIPHLLALEYAIKAVPTFDGQNIPIEDFIEGCEIAKSLLPPGAEEYFTKIIRIKLTGDARCIILDKNFTQIDQLISYLKNIFGPTKSLFQLQDELRQIYQNDHESVLSYANRIKAIKKDILETYSTPNNGIIDHVSKISLEKAVCTSFIIGLKPEIEKRIKRNLDLTATISEALQIENYLKDLHIIHKLRIQDRKFIANICQNCHGSVHAVEHCSLLIQSPNANWLNNEKIICQICKKQNHSADKCQFRSLTNQSPIKIIQNDNVICQICLNSGHTAQTCRFINTRFNIICQTYRKPRHSSRECRINSSNFNTIICQICAKSGHNAKNCYSTPDRNIQSDPSFNKVTCQWYGQRGTYALQCRNRLSNSEIYTTYNALIICQLCNKIGHKARECHINQESNDNFNQTLEANIMKDGIRASTSSNQHVTNNQKEIFQSTRSISITSLNEDLEGISQSQVEQSKITNSKDRDVDFEHKFSNEILNKDPKKIVQNSSTNSKIDKTKNQKKIFKISHEILKNKSKNKNYEFYENTNLQNNMNQGDIFQLPCESLSKKSNKEQEIKFLTSYKNINSLRNNYQENISQVPLISLCKNLDKNQKGNLQTSYPSPYIQKQGDNFQIPHKIPKINLSENKKGNFQSSYNLVHKELNKNLEKNIQIFHKILNEKLHKKHERNLQRQNPINIIENYSKKFNETQEGVSQASYENIKTQKIKIINIDFRSHDKFMGNLDKIPLDTQNSLPCEILTHIEAKIINIKINSINAISVAAHPTPIISADGTMTLIFIIDKQYINVSVQTDKIRRIKNIANGNIEIATKIANKFNSTFSNTDVPQINTTNFHNETAKIRKHDAKIKDITRTIETNDYINSHAITYLQLLKTEIYYCKQLIQLLESYISTYWNLERNENFTKNMKHNQLNLPLVQLVSVNFNSTLILTYSLKICIMIIYIVFTLRSHAFIHDSFKFIKHLCQRKKTFRINIYKCRYVIYALRVLNDHQTMYINYEKKALTITYFIEYFILYLYWQKFFFIKDYKNLAWFKNTKYAKRRILQWRLELPEYNYGVIYETEKTISKITILLQNFIKFLFQNCIVTNYKLELNFNNPKDTKYIRRIWKENTDSEELNISNCNLHPLDIDEMDDFLTTDSILFTPQKLAKACKKQIAETQVYAIDATETILNQTTEKQMHASESTEIHGFNPNDPKDAESIRRLEEDDDYKESDEEDIHDLSNNFAQSAKLDKDNTDQMYQLDNHLLPEESETRDPHKTGQVDGHGQTNSVSFSTNQQLGAIEEKSGTKGNQIIIRPHQVAADNVIAVKRSKAFQERTTCAIHITGPGEAIRLQDESHLKESIQLFYRYLEEFHKLTLQAIINGVQHKAFQTMAS